MDELMIAASRALGEALSGAGKEYNTVFGSSSDCSSALSNAGSGR